ncbi:MAG: hypothetical protein ACLQM8_27055, partial [Limisphaerales bacterium]
MASVANVTNITFPPGPLHRGEDRGRGNGPPSKPKGTELALQRHFEELTTDCTDCTDNTMVDCGPSVKSVKSVVETSKEVSL